MKGLNVLTAAVWCRELMVEPICSHFLVCSSFGAGRSMHTRKFFVVSNNFLFFASLSSSFKLHTLDILEDSLNRTKLWCSKIVNILDATSALERSKFSAWFPQRDNRIQISQLDDGGKSIINNRNSEITAITISYREGRTGERHRRRRDRSFDGPQRYFVSHGRL